MPRPAQRPASTSDARKRALERVQAEHLLTNVFGMCTAYGSVEVALVEVSGIKDLADLGESSEYPTGHGCEVCA